MRHPATCKLVGSAGALLGGLGFVAEISGGPDGRCQSMSSPRDPRSRPAAPPLAAPWLPGGLPPDFPTRWPPSPERLASGSRQRDRSPPPPPMQQLRRPAYPAGPRADYHSEMAFLQAQALRTQQQQQQGRAEARGRGGSAEWWQGSVRGYPPPPPWLEEMYHAELDSARREYPEALPSRHPADLRGPPPGGRHPAMWPPPSSRVYYPPPPHEVAEMYDRWMFPPPGAPSSYGAGPSSYRGGPSPYHAGPPLPPEELRGPRYYDWGIEEMPSYTRRRREDSPDERHAAGEHSRGESSGRKSTGKSKSAGKQKVSSIQNISEERGSLGFPCVTLRCGVGVLA